MTLTRADSGYATHYHAVKPEWQAGKETDVLCQSHLLREEMSQQADDYVLRNWDFSDDRARQDFLNSGVSRLACLYFPLALDERISSIASLFCLLYLIGQSLAELDDVDDGEEYLEALEAAVKGHWSLEETVPAVWMICGIFDEMRAQDYMIVDDIFDTTFAHLRASLVRRGRSTQRKGLHSSNVTNVTLRIGASLISALEPFAMGSNADFDGSTA